MELIKGEGNLKRDLNGKGTIEIEVNGKIDFGGGTGESERIGESYSRH